MKIKPFIDTCTKYERFEVISGKNYCLFSKVCNDRELVS